MLWTYLMQYGFMLLTLWKKKSVQDDDIDLFDIGFTALTRSSGLKRKWSSSDALGFCMCFFNLACRGHSDRYTVRRWWWATDGHDELGRLGAVISHQEVEGQLHFLQAIDELCFRGRLGSQGQHALCEQPDSRVTGRTTTQHTGFTFRTGLITPHAVLSSTFISSKNKDQQFNNSY